MKTKTVKQVRMHVGVTIKNQVLTSLDADKHGLELELTAAGVAVDSGDVEHFIPFTNITSVQMMPVTAPSATKGDKK